MDASVKQRLVGATVLVVLAVIFLPMVFDGSEESRTESIDLGIPAEPGRDFETRVVPLDAPGAAAPVLDPGAIVTVDANAPDRPDALAGTNAAPAPRPEPAPPRAPPTSVPAAAPVQPTAAVAATATPNPASVPAAGAAEASPPSDPRGRYAVSFGSYARADNAHALTASLRKGGVEARAEDVDVNGQPGMRVRAGPFIDRAQAEQVRLLAKRARADVSGTVIEIDETPANAATAPAAAIPAAATRTEATPPTATAPVQRPGSGWAVQVAAYQAEADATSQRDKLRASGFSAYVDTVRTESGTMHRVRVGPETQRVNADALRGSLKAKLGLDGLVVPHP